MKILRRLIITLVVLVLVAFFGAGLLVRMAAPRVQQELVDMAAAEGLELRIQGLKVGTRWWVWPDSVSMQKACLVAGEPARDRVCAEQLDVSFIIFRLGGRYQPKPTAIQVSRVTIDASETGWIQELTAAPQAEEGDPGEDAEGLEEAAQQANLHPGLHPVLAPLISQFDEYPSVQIGRIEALVPEGLPVVGLYLEAPELSVQQNDLSIVFDLQTIQEPGALDPALEALLSYKLRVEILADAQAGWTVGLSPTDGTPLQADLGNFYPGLEFQASKLAVNWQHELSVEGLRIASETSPRLELGADELSLRLRDWPTGMEDLYMARLHTTGLDLFLDMEDRTLSETLELLAANVPQPEASEDDDEDEDDEERPHPWEGRIWYEKIPQSISIYSSKLRLGLTEEAWEAHKGEEPVGADEFAGEFVLDIMSLTARLHALQPVYQVNTTALWILPDGRRGNIETDTRWDWIRQRLDSRLSLQAIDLTTSRWISPELRALQANGMVSLDLEFHPDAVAPDMPVTLRTDLNRVQFQPSWLESPLGIAYFITVLKGEFQDSDSGGINLVVRDDDALAGFLQTTLEATFFEVDIDKPTLFDSATFRVKTEPQQGHMVFWTVPLALVGPELRDAVLGGVWSFEIEFPFRWRQPENPEGRPGIEIGAPTTYVVNDQDFSLEELPEAVDVRRLNTGMSFTFTGPPGTPPRRLGIPPPGAEADELPPQGWTRLEDVSYFLVAALLYQEDGRFFRNHGINWYQLRSVVSQAWEQGRLGRGASTISMQLVKNVFLSHERSITRKFQELFLTYWMTRLVPKERILEVYLNVIEWGPGINGITEAARYYFDVSPAKLTLAQSVWLAAAVPAPVRRSQQRAMGSPPDWSRRHVETSMRSLARSGWITESELQSGLRQNIRFVGGRDVASGTVDLPDDDLDPVGLPFVNGTGMNGQAEGAGSNGRPSAAGIQLALPPHDRLRALIESRPTTNRR